MQKKVFSIFGLTVMLMGLFVYFNQALATSSNIGDGSTGGGGADVRPTNVNGPDLTVKYIKNRYNNQDVTLTSTVPANVPLTFEAIIGNGGLGTSTTTDLDIYVDSVLKKRVSVGGILGSGSVPPNGGSGHNTEFYTWTPTAAHHQLRFVVDPMNMNVESNESNNVYELQLNTTSNTAKPDLTITAVQVVPEHPIVGQTVTVKVAVKNLGAALTSGQGIDNWFASFQDLSWSGGVALLGARQVDTTHPMLTGETIIYSGNGVFGSNGDKVGSFIVDNANELPEMNESNNNYDKTIRVGLVSDDAKLKIEDLTATGITFQSAVVKWRTNVESKGVVYYMPMDNSSSTHMSLISTSTSNWLKAYDEKVRTNHEVNLRNLLSNKKYRYYVISTAKDGSVARSEVKDFDTRGVGRNSEEDQEFETPHADDTTPVILPDGTKPRDDKRPLPKKPLPVTSDEQALRERIKRLELRISELESKLIEREKSLAQPTDKRLTDRVKGELLLQVEGNGEVWYIDPITGKKYYFKDGDSAYKAMQAFGLGISETDLAKIPVGTDPKVIDQDTDSDGIADSTEQAIGTDPANPDSDSDGFKDGEEVTNNYSPLGQNKVAVDATLQKNLKGRIVLNVKNGNSWYINAKDGKRYFLGNGAQAYKIMKYLSTGATNDDLRKIEVGELQTDATQ